MNYTYHPIFDDIINAACCEMVTFFDKEKNAFVMHNIHEVSENTALILVPYREECNYLAMRNFWSSLTDEECTLAGSFNEKYGFFEFLRSTGLIYSYYDAELLAFCEILEKWKSSNNLSFDWDSVDYI